MKRGKSGLLFWIVIVLVGLLVVLFTQLPEMPLTGNVALDDEVPEVEVEKGGDKRM